MFEMLYIVCYIFNSFFFDSKLSIAYMTLSPTTHFNALFSRFACFSLLIKCDRFPPGKSKKSVF